MRENDLKIQKKILHSAKFIEKIVFQIRNISIEFVLEFGKIKSKIKDILKSYGNTQELLETNLKK